MRVTKVTANNPKMAAAIETVQEGKAYKVVVTPEQTKEPGAAILWIECTSSSGVQRTLTTYAHIKASVSPQPPIQVAK